MAKNDKAVAEERAEAAAQQETKAYVFNQDTGIVGYTFPDGVKFRLGPTYFLDEQQVKDYAREQVNGKQLLVTKK